MRIIHQHIMSKHHSSSVVYALITLALFLILMNATTYMFTNMYISTEKHDIESFASGTTHNVNLPLNTTYSCENMCGPPGRCSITGTQCLSDIDCYGCQPNSSPDLNNTFLLENKKIIGANDGGKMSFLAPSYSPLVKDISYHAKRNKSDDPYTRPVQFFQGHDTWTTKAADMRKIYDLTYQPPPNTPYLSKYPARFSATGMFRYTGPYASNASLKPYYDGLDTSKVKKL